MKLVGRGDTTVVDAYLSPILSRYVRQIAAELGVAPDATEPRLMFMMSSGGLTAVSAVLGSPVIPVARGRAWPP